MKQKKALKRGILETIMWIGTLIVFIPYALVLITSFKTCREAGLFRLTLPTEWQIVENYKLVFEKGDILLGFKNSILITGVSVALILFSAVMLSYYISRANSGSRGRKRFTSWLYIFIVAGMTAPMSLVTTYQLLTGLELIGTKLGVVFIYCGMLIPFATFIFVGFIKTIPRELDEAAVIDGCGPTRLFFTIILPLLKPVTFTCFILVFMAVWNDAQIILFFLGNSNDWTMPMTIYKFFGYYRADWNLIFGSVFLTTLPVLIIYLFGQRYIIDGMVAGSIKG